MNCFTSTPSPLHGEGDQNMQSQFRRESTPLHCEFQVSRRGSDSRANPADAKDCRMDTDMFALLWGLDPHKTY